MRTGLLLGFLAVPALTIGAESTNLGAIDFPNSGGKEAQEAFLRGVGALHNFWYEEAGEAFKTRSGDRPRIRPRVLGRGDEL